MVTKILFQLPMLLFPMLLLGILFLFIRKAFVSNKPVEAQKIKFLSVIGIIFSVFSGLLLIIESIQYSINLFTIVGILCIIIDILCYCYINKSLININYLQKSLKTGIFVSIARIAYCLPHFFHSIMAGAYSSLLSMLIQVVFSVIILIIACNVLKVLKSSK